MARFLSLLLLSFTSIAIAQEQSTHFCHFENAESSVSPKEKDSLQAWFGRLPEGVCFLVEGHTDEVGSSQANSILAQKRCETVAQLLDSWGAKKDSVELKAYGEERPRADNSTKEGKEENRRVKITAAFSTDTSTIWQLFRLLDEGYQTFEIDPGRDTLLKAKGSILIKIPANAFELESDCRSVKITIRVKEAYTVDEMVSQNLSTTSNGRMLQTRGMAYIDAICGNKPLKLKRGKNIVNFVPLTDPIPGLRVFNGRHQRVDSIINWQAAPEALLAQMDSYGLGMCCTGLWQPCDLFFCKIRRFFKRLFGKDDSTLSRIDPKEPCNMLKSFLARYDIELDSTEQLVVLFEEYGVENFSELARKLEEELYRKTEERLTRGRGTSDDFEYFVYRQTQLGWTNIDAFMDFPKRDLITLKTNLINDSRTQIFLVFKSMEMILPPTNYSGPCHFKDIPKNREVKLVALKYKSGQAFIGTKDFKVSKEIQSVDFQKVSLLELKAELAKLSG